VLGEGDSKKHEPRRGRHKSPCSITVMGPQTCAVHRGDAPRQREALRAAHQHGPGAHVQQRYPPVSGAEESGLFVCGQPDDGEAGGQHHGPAALGCPPTHAGHSQHQLKQPRDQHSSRDLREEERTRPVWQGTQSTAHHSVLATLPPPQ